MSTSQVLQHLYSLDISSQNIPRYLYYLIQRDEEEHYLSSLQGLDLARLVDFLDEVRGSSSTFRPVTDQIPQALGVIPTTDDVSRQCLHKLQAICGDNMILPSSHNISGDLARVGDHPISVDGASADVWEGAHNGRKVCIKCPRVSEEDLQTVTQVRVRCPLNAIFCAYSKIAADAVVISQRSRYMEKIEAPKYRPVHWCYNKTLAIRFGVYAERNSNEICREESECGSDWSGEPFLRNTA